MFEKLTELLEENNYVDFINEIDSMNYVDAADFLNYVEPKNIVLVFRLLKKDTAAEIFPELDPALQEMIITSITDNEINKLIEELFIDDTIDLLEELPANVVNRIIKISTPQTRAEINKFLKYPSDSAGSIMTSEFLTVHASMSVNDAIERIREIGEEKETIYTIYVTDSKRILLGTVGLRDLIFSKKDLLISDIMDTSVIFGKTLDNKEETAALVSKYDLLALPIVDNEQRIVGIVTVDDALHVIEEAATEDIEIMAGISPTDKTYLKTGVFETFKKRIPWLLVLLITATLTGGIISYFESVLGSMIVLTSFIPMLMNTGGNAGSQSSVAVIRSLSLGELRMGDIFRIIWKEFRISILCSISLSIVIFAKTYFLDSTSLEVALVVSLTLFCTVIIAKIVGCSLPVLAKRLNLDPAVMASPFITTILDTLSLFIYFNFATVLLNI